MLAAISIATCCHQKGLIVRRIRLCLEAMIQTGKCRLVMVTAPDIKTARRLARAALKARLVACANLVPQIESHYWWQGRIERGNEVLLLLKTTTAALDRLEKLVLAEHPYDTPEFLVLPLSAGNRKYLTWVTRSCAFY